MQEIIYTQNAIDFVKIAVEYCSMVENTGKQSKETFIDQACKILPMLYLKALLLQSMEENLESSLENGISQEMYDHVQSAIAELLGENDLFLEIFHPDMPYSDTPVAITISENMADIYQDLGNFIYIFKNGHEQTMYDSLYECIENFKEYWGQKLVNVLRPIHQLKFNTVDNNDF